jgi:hypothetical protein
MGPGHLPPVVSPPRGQRSPEEERHLRDVYLHVRGYLTEQWRDPPAGSYVGDAFFRVLSSLGPPPIDKDDVAQKVLKVAKNAYRADRRKQDNRNASIDEDDSLAKTSAKASPEHRVAEKDLRLKILAATREHFARAANAPALQVFEAMMAEGETEPAALAEALGIPRQTVYNAIQAIRDFAKKWQAAQAKVEIGEERAQADA